MTRDVLTPSACFALRYDFLIGPYNGVSMRTRRLVETRLEVVKPFPIWKPGDFEKLDIPNYWVTSCCYIWRLAFAL